MTSQVDQVGLFDEHGDHHSCHISLIAHRVLQVKTYFFVHKKKSSSFKICSLNLYALL